MQGFDGRTRRAGFRREGRNAMMDQLLSGVLLGLSAGLSPGPLTSLVVEKSLRHGFREGFMVALAPLLTDLPIVAAAIFVLSRAGAANGVLPAVSLAGAVFLAFLGIKSMAFSGVAGEAGTENPPRSLRQGALANFLNPNPYLFWATVGAPTIVSAYAESMGSAVAFAASFYALLVGVKTLMAFLSARSRSFISGRGYVWTIRALGLSLIVFAAVFLRSGLRGFGLL